MDKLNNDLNIPIVPDLLKDIQESCQFTNAVSLESREKIKNLHDELETKARQHGTEHPVILAGLYDLVDLYVEAHQYYIGERLLKRLQTAYRRTFKSPHLSIAKSLTRLGDILVQQIKYEESEKYYLESLKQYTQLIDIENDLTIEKTYKGLGVSYSQQQMYEESEYYYKKLLILYRKSFNEEHPKILETISDLTSVLEVLEKYKEAEELCGSSLDNCIRIMGEDHPVTQKASAALARVKENSGNQKEAEDMYRKAIKFSSMGLGSQHHQTITLKYALSKLLIKKLEYEESEHILVDVITGQELNKGEYDRETLEMYQNLGELYLLKLQVFDARKYFEKAFNGRSKVEGEKHPMTYYSLFYIGKSYHVECYWRNSLEYFPSLAKAEEILKKVYDGLVELLGYSYPLTMEVSLYYGDFLLQFDKWQKAEFVFQALMDYYHELCNVDELIIQLQKKMNSRQSTSAATGRTHPSSPNLRSTNNSTSSFLPGLTNNFTMRATSPFTPSNTSEHLFASRPSSRSENQFLGSRNQSRGNMIENSTTVHFPPLMASSRATTPGLSGPMFRTARSTNTRLSFSSRRSSISRKGIKIKALNVIEYMRFGEICYKLGVVNEKLRKLLNAQKIFEKSYYLFTKAEFEWEAENKKTKAPNLTTNVVSKSRKNSVVLSTDISLAPESVSETASTLIPSSAHTSALNSRAPSFQMKRINFSEITVDENDVELFKQMEKEANESKQQRKLLEEIIEMKDEAMVQVKHTQYLNEM